MISVIIPLYNKEKCIGRAIESVLSQSYTDFELLVIDDGSTDNSSAIVKKYSDSRVRYIHKNNGGVSSARNYGVKLASGNWVFFLDADDVLLPNAIQSLVDGTVGFPWIQIVIGGYIVKDLEKEYKKTPRCSGHIKNPMKHWWLRNIFPRTGNILLTKEAFWGVGGFDERISYNEDYALLLKLLSIYEIVVIPQITMIYTDDNKTLSIRKTPLNAEIGAYLSPLSKENVFINLSIYNQYRYTIDRRLEMQDKEGAAAIINEMKRSFTTIDRIRNYVLNKTSGLFNRIFASE